MENLSWSFYQVWNRSLENRKTREVKPRDRIWASELGGAMIDRYYKMTGVQCTNPPNARSLRKFEAGNIWESIIGYVLKRAGIYQGSQGWKEYRYEGLLPVVGKLDFLAGGKPDYDNALNIIATEFSWLPESITKATKDIILYLKEKYPAGLKTIILEVKSTSAMMFDNYERKDKPATHHKLQLYHYLKSSGLDEGHIVYVSRDDARLKEFGVICPSQVEKEYYKDILDITEYYKKKEVPPKEDLIIFSEFGKFTINYKVAYSNYLTMIYGFENQKEYEDKYKPIAERWNRVLGRIKLGKKMTDNNLQALEEIKEAGFDIEKIKSEIIVEGGEDEVQA